MIKTISIVLLVKNGAEYLPELLDSLIRQKGDFEKEIIVVDSESSDASLKILQEHAIAKTVKIVIERVKQKDFGHGKTRNLAVRKAGGEIMVFLSQDALPAGKDWLRNLVGPLLMRAGETAGVFGRQVPYPGTNACEQFFLNQSYPDKSRMMSSKDSNKFSNQYLFFSNVNGAARRDLLLKFPFRNDLTMSEDQYWARVCLKNGYKIVYEPKALVFHSHNYNLWQLAGRSYLGGVAHRQMDLSGEVVQKGAGSFLPLLRFVLYTKPWFFPYAVLYYLVKAGAFLAGRYL